MVPQVRGLRGEEEDGRARDRVERKGRRFTALVAAGRRCIVLVLLLRLGLVMSFDR